MKYLIILMVVLLTACNSGHYTNGSQKRYAEDCIGGVVYYVSTYKLAPAFKPDGTLYLCGAHDETKRNY